MGGRQLRRVNLFSNPFSPNSKGYDSCDLCFPGNTVYPLTPPRLLVFFPQSHRSSSPLEQIFESSPPPAARAAPESDPSPDHGGDLSSFRSPERFSRFRGGFAARWVWGSLLPSPASGGLGLSALPTTPARGCRAPSASGSELALPPPLGWCAVRSAPGATWKLRAVQRA